MRKALPHLRKTASVILISLEVFVGFICFYFTFAFYGMVFSCGDDDPKKEITVYIRSNGVHTDICIPTVSEQKNWLSDFDLQDYEDKSRKAYVGIGWGDKGFFLDTPTWAELKASTAVKAVFLPSPTAMHVEFMDEPSTSEHIRKVKISKKNYQKLVKFIESTFRRKQQEPILIPGQGYGMTDNFYEAFGNYHLFNTCNVWTNDAMKSASIPTSIFSVFPEGNLMHLEK